MSKWALVPLVCVLAAGTARAQNTPGVQAEPPPLEVGVNALPGGDHVGYAESLPQGTVSTAFGAGFGFRKDLLASGHSMSRGAATAAIAYSIADLFSVSLLLDGRYDKHSGNGLDDDGWVGEPRLNIRAGKSIGAVAIGGQLTVWTPGKDAPSIVPKATSIELRGLVSKQLGSGLRVGFNAGYRYDNSARSVENQMDLSVADQSSLGVCQWNAAVVGLRVGYPTGKLVIGFDAEVDMYLGSSKVTANVPKPRPSLLLGASVGYRISNALTAELFLASNLQEKPEVSAMGTIPLIPYGPVLAGGIQLQARFGGPKPPGSGDDGGLGDGGKTTCDDPDPAKRPADCPATPPPPTRATIAGQITDDTGAPIANARVTITDCKGKATTATTDDKGNYTATDLEPCEVTVVAEAPNRLAQTVKVGLSAGDNTAPVTPLPPAVKPGTFRFVIRSFATGKGVEANIEINPGGQKIVAAADGSTKIDIQPGTYTLKITSAGLKDQTREYVVTENNVVIVNVDLRK
jgi:hypothetical protein